MSKLFNIEKRHLSTLAIIAFAGMISPLLAFAEDDDNDSHLLRSWGGARSFLAENGVTTEAIVTHDIFANTDGGVSRDHANMGNIDITAKVDIKGTYPTSKNAVVFGV